MKYALLIYAAEKDLADKSDEERERLYNDYWAYSTDLKNSGKMLSCEPLDPTSTATTVRVRDGKTIATDGPFADTKEQLGGIYVIDVKDLDEAMSSNDDWRRHNGEAVCPDRAVSNVNFQSRHNGAAWVRVRFLERPARQRCSGELHAQQPSFVRRRPQRVVRRGLYAVANAPINARRALVGGTRGM